jgi:hypothetical protein
LEEAEEPHHTSLTGLRVAALNALDVSSCRFFRPPSATSELSGIDRQFDSSDHPLMRCGIPRWDTWAPCGMLQNNDYHRYTVHGIRLVRRGHMTDAESFTSRLPALRSKCFGGFRISLESTTTFHANVHPLVSCGQSIPAVAKNICLEPRCILIRKRECAYLPGN